MTMTKNTGKTIEIDFEAYNKLLKKYNRLLEKYNELLSILKEIRRIIKEGRENTGERGVRLRSGVPYSSNRR